MQPSRLLLRWQVASLLAAVQTESTPELSRAVQASQLLLGCQVAFLLAAGKAGSHTKAGLDQLLGPAQQLLGMWTWHLAHDPAPM